MHKQPQPLTRPAARRHAAPEFGAVILAGGRSSRMGVPKAWIEWRGEPLLLHVLRAVQAICEGPAIVVGAPGQELPELPPGARRVDDPPDQARGGPLVGILAGLRALAAPADGPAPEGAYLGACDGVYLDVAHVGYVVHALRDAPELQAVVPRDPADARGRRFLHPLASAVRVRPALAEAEAIVASGGRRPLFLFERLRTRYLDVSALPSPDALRTCNTPEELARARAELIDA